jgi:hypothetical protein
MESAEPNKDVVAQADLRSRKQFLYPFKSGVKKYLKATFAAIRLNDPQLKHGILFPILPSHLWRIRGSNSKMPPAHNSSKQRRSIHLVRLTHMQTLAQFGCTTQRLTQL